MRYRFILFVITVFSVYHCFLQTGPSVLAEQSGSSPESGVVSKIRTIYDSLVTLTYGSESAGVWGDWGVIWNRIRSAAEWVPAGDADEADVAEGKIFYKDSRTQKTGTASLAPDWSTFSKVTWDDGRNSHSADGDNAGEESSWANTAGGATTGVWKDTRTGLYWDASHGVLTNNFTVSSCDFFTSSPRSSYDGSDSDCGNAINACASLSLDSDGDSTPETDWYLPSYKELLLAHVDGIYNQTNGTFVTPSKTFWSHTELSAYSGWAFGVNLGGSSLIAESRDKLANPTSYEVRCVRRD